MFTKLLSLVLLCLVLLVISCNLVAVPIENVRTVYWVAVGDDGNIGTASTYDFRYYTEPITDANWNDCTLFTGLPVPAVAGTQETATLTFLAESQDTIYIAAKVADNFNNWSSLSNVLMFIADDFIPPAPLVLNK